MVEHGLTGRYPKIMGAALSKRIAQEKFESPLTEAMLNLLVASDYMRAKMDVLTADFGISSGQYNVLRILRGAHPVGHSRCEIARRMVERAPDVTRLVDKLEAQGWVERDRAGGDRRLSVSRITKEGLALLDSMQAAIKEMEHHFAERINVRDRRELSRICEGIYGEPDALS